MKATQEKLNQLLQNMWEDYCNLNPQAKAVYNSLTNEGESVVNDHIALRTFSHPKININALEKTFLNFGYNIIGNYKFESKKLNARHYEHSNPNRPKVFISELDLNLNSEFIKKTVNEIVEQIPTDKIQQEIFIYSGRPWNASYETYQKMAKDSEYAAWVYAMGFRPNHFTVFVNELKKYNDIKNLNSFLKKQGFSLNASGGEVKGSPEEYLEQSSTLANEIDVSFDEGFFKIPACYYEFAKRYTQKDGKLYQGFIAQSADKIFESTNRA